MLTQALMSGLFLASIYALAAFGLVIVFGVLDILNFAHGALMILGAYMAVGFMSLGPSFAVAAVMAIVGVALIGLVLQVAVFRRLETDPIAGLVASVGLIAIIDAVILKSWGPAPQRLPQLTEGSVVIFDARVPSDRIVIIVLAFTILIAAEFYISRSRQGKELRATALDEDAAALQGIAVRRVKTVAFTFGAATAAFAGVLFGTTSQFEVHSGSLFVIKAFIIIIIGGVGSTKGALAGALVLGMSEAVAITYLNVAIAQLVPLALVILVLLVRPRGLFGLSVERA